MRADVFKRTSDDWYPSYRLSTGWNKDTNDDMLVKVSFIQLHGDCGWRVCAWGHDDCGMEKDFVSEMEAWTCFLVVIGLDDVTMVSLKDMGFVSA